MSFTFNVPPHHEGVQTEEESAMFLGLMPRYYNNNKNNNNFITCGHNCFPFFILQKRNYALQKSQVNYYSTLKKWKCVMERILSSHTHMEYPASIHITRKV